MTEYAHRSIRWHRPETVAAELRRRNAVLFGVAALHGVLLVGFVAGIALDPRTVGGEPAWLKPAKFAGSITLFAATLGWIGYHFPVADETLRRASLAVATAAVIEITLIGGQAARGTESHFNTSTTLDFAVYAVMGLTIIGMVTVVAWLLVRAWRREFDVAPAFGWGIRLGIALFVVGSFEGGAMVAIQASAIESGPSLPVVGWTASGDFRAAHFVGLHALQSLPLAGYLAAVANDQGRLSRPVRAVKLVAAGYAALLVAAFVHALP
jgi:hypothetical protein